MNTKSGSSNPDFDAFVASGDVEVGDSNAAPAENTPTEEKPRRGPPKTKEVPKPAVETNRPAPEDDTGSENDDPEDDEDLGDAETSGNDENEEDPEAPRRDKSAKQRIKDLNARLRKMERLLAAEQASKTSPAPQNQPLPNPNGNGNSSDIGTAPDPADPAKYPLGHLDERYIEDKLEWLATKKAAERADAVLQRQQEDQTRQTLEQQQTALRQKVDTLADKGSEMWDDYQETVVDTAMAGEWILAQPTFDAASEVDHGPEILRNLAMDKKEAARVASLSPYAQIKYVDAKNTEITERVKGKRIPSAGAPPSSQPRGGNSRVRINPSTENLDDFEKAWEADAKAKKR